MVNAAAQVEIEIFDLRAPARRERDFDAAAHRSSRLASWAELAWRGRQGARPPRPHSSRPGRGMRRRWRKRASSRAHSRPSAAASRTTKVSGCSSPRTLRRAEAGNGALRPPLSPLPSKFASRPRTQGPVCQLCAPTSLLPDDAVKRRGEGGEPKSGDSEGVVARAKGAADIEPPA